MIWGRTLSSPASSDVPMATDTQSGRESDISQRWEHHHFRIGSCPACDRLVLTARDLIDDELVDCCLHCEHPFEGEQIRWAPPKEVVELGYFIDGYEHPDLTAESGCNGGSCGVQQPDSIQKE